MCCKKIGIGLLLLTAVGGTLFACYKCGCFDKQLMKRKIRGKITCLEQALEKADDFVVKM